MPTLVVPFEAVGLTSIAQVGGKNASLGELVRRLASAGVAVPPGFATTAQAYRLLLASPIRRGRAAWARRWPPLSTA